MVINRPSHLTLQWHLTEACQLHCTHCYQDGMEKPKWELPMALKILEDFSQWVRDWQIPGHITITGGEPALWPGLVELCTQISKSPGKLSFSLLSNGLLLDAPLLQKLKDLGCRSIQVSIEGDQLSHDAIRGPGNLGAVLKAIKRIKKAQIPTLVSFTAGKANFQDFAKVHGLCRKAGATALWSDRLLPLGQSKDSPLMTPQEVQGFFEEMAKKHLGFSQAKVKMHRALQFIPLREQGYAAKPYRCHAGSDLICLLPNGDVLPCRRLPIPVGNVFENSLRDIYQGSSILKKLRDPEEIPKGCERCPYKRTCAGGLRCLSMAISGSPFQKDPQCIKTFPEQGVQRMEIKGNLEALNLSPGLKKDLTSFLDQLTDFYGKDLLTVTLFGSAVKGSFLEKTSDLNLLVVYSDLNVADLQKVSNLARKWLKKRRFAPRFLSKRNLECFGNIFPVDLLDMKSAYQVLLGEDLLGGIKYDPKALAWQTGYELKAMRLKIKQQFWRVSASTAGLRRVITDRMGSLKLLARSLLVLEDKDPGHSEAALFSAMASRWNLKRETLTQLSQLKNPKTALNKNQGLIEFSELMDLVRKLDDHAQGLIK